MPDPLTIILFIVFVVLPLVNGLLKGQQQQPQRPRTQRTNQGPAQRKVPAGPTPTGPASENDDFSRRLEEARRRVQDAMGAELGTDTASHTGTTTASTGEPPLVSPPASRRDQEFQEPARRPSAPVTFDTPSTALHTSRARMAASRDTETAPPLRVQRGTRTKPATISQGNLLRIDADEVQRGVLWHQILSEPRSRKSLGRNRLRPRSR